MAITFRCECGRELVAPDEYAGRQVRCGLCGAARVVPAVSEPAPDYPPGAQQPPPGMQMPPFGVPPGAPPPGAGASQPAYGPAWRPHHVPHWPPPSYGPPPPPPPPYQPHYGAYHYKPPVRWMPSCSPASQLPEQAGRMAAIAALIFGTIGIGGHALGWCMMWCGWIVVMFGCSLAAFIAGWVGASAAVAPDVKADACLGRALGLIGLLAGAIFLIFIQIPVIRNAIEM